MAERRDPTREVANFLADDATWDKRVDHALLTLANGQARMASELSQVKGLVQAIPQQISDAAASNRQFYQRLQTRLDDELGNDFDDVSGSHDVRSLRDAGRTWRKRARDEEDARLKEAAARELEAARAKELEAAVHRGKVAVAVAGPLLLALGGLIAQLLK